MALPDPDANAQAQSHRLQELIRREIDAQGGWLPFSRYMALALYAPGLGYYAGGSTKFGAAGDFVTAPELSPLFAQTLATQVAEILDAAGPQVLEAGAGSGALAADLLLELERRDALPDSYAILELSGELAARQKETLQTRAPHLVDRVTWLSAFPDDWDGAVLGNELLDAMPVELVEWRDQGVFERGVCLAADGKLGWTDRPAEGALQVAAATLPVSAPYRGEIGLAASAWVAEWGRRLRRGALLLIDYGFPRAEFWHPQRAAGTLMCHYRNHAHDDPLWWPGLNDITTHIDFTSIAEAGYGAGLDVLGYTSQASFLMNCGILDILGRGDAEDARAFIPQARVVDKLTNPAEMGELFKVIALGRGLNDALVGFRRSDRTHTL